MTAGPTRLFDDMARLAGGAAGIASGVGTEVQALVKQQAERMVQELDLVTRDDFDAMAELAANAKTEVEALNARVDALEARLAVLEGK